MVFQFLLENFKSTEIAFFFESEIRNPKSCLNGVFIQVLFSTPVLNYS